MIEQVMTYIQQNAHIAPWLMFGLLLLAGFNLPVSEDAMLFISGILAAKNPDLAIPLFTGVFLGAYISDLICYAFMGRFLGSKLTQIKFFAKMLDQKKIDHVTDFYHRYGVWTLIIGRFIPFGIRNALFISAGLGKMNALKFALSDLLACAISCSFFFWLYYSFGNTVIEYVKKGNIVIFSVFALAATGYFIHKKIDDRKKRGLEDKAI